MKLFIVPMIYAHYLMGKLKIMGSNLLKVIQQVTAGVKTGPQNLELSLMFFFNTCNCPGPWCLAKHEASII